jgi:hypothetical protein
MRFFACAGSQSFSIGGADPPRDGARRARVRLAAPRSGRRPSEACRPSRGAAGPRHAPLCSCSIWRSSMRFQGGARGSLSPVVGRPLSQQTTRVPGSAAPPACVMARPSSRRRWSGRPGLTCARWRAITCCPTACRTTTSAPSTSPLATGPRPYAASCAARGISVAKSTRGMPHSAS